MAPAIGSQPDSRDPAESLGLADRRARCAGRGGAAARLVVRRRRAGGSLPRRCCTSRSRCAISILLDRALDGHRRVPLFETRGLWAEIFARVDKLRTKARNRKKKYHRLLREVRESTGALSDGGIILNADHEIMWFNPAAARLLGLEPCHRRRPSHRQPAAPSRLRRLFERTERRWHQRRVAAPRNRLAARADHPVRHRLNGWRSSAT